MSTPDKAAVDNASLTKTAKGKRIIKSLKKSVQLQDEGEHTGLLKLVRETLPRMAKYFDGTAWEHLNQTEPWLEVFEPTSTSDWNDAKVAFNTNGPAILQALVRYTDLIHLESLIACFLSNMRIACMLSNKGSARILGNDEADTLPTRLLLKLRDDLYANDSPIKNVKRSLGAILNEKADKICAIATANIVGRDRIVSLLKNQEKAGREHQ